MAQIAHLSDVHFGRHDPTAVTAILNDLATARPDLVVVSGDFTQRARRSQFREARVFLDAVKALGLAWLAVPGNHDIPLYDVARRFLTPLKRYRHFITRDLTPRYDAAGVAVLGINTARSLTISDGRVSEEQIAALSGHFADVPAAAMRVLVTHHPLVALPWGEEGALLEAAGRSPRALAAAVEASVDVLLAGHHHRSFAGSAHSVAATHGSLLIIQAGTATSTRVRGERNSYNLIDIGTSTVEIEVRARDTGPFKTVRTECHQLADGCWTTTAAS